MKNSLLTTTEHPLRRDLIVFTLLLTVVFAVYWKALSNGFLLNWDDPNYVVNNPDAHGFSLEHVKNAFSRFYVGNYAPLHIVSYMFDYTLWGLRPSGYIFHNLLLHTVNGFLLYRLVNRFSAAVFPSILSALLFIVHPVQVESVVWISQRKNLLAMLFFLIAFHMYLAFRGAENGVGRKYYALSLIFFACSLLAKSVAVILPAVLLLYDICVTRRRFREALADKMPFIAIAVATGIMAVLSQSEYYGGGGKAAFHGGSPYATFLTMIPVFVTYLKLIVLPAGLSGVYATEIKTAFDSSVAVNGAILLLFAGCAWFIFRRDRKLFFWLALGVIGIVPVSQIIPLVTLINDRYLYFPMAGVAPFVVIGAFTVLSGQKETLRNITAVVLLLISVVFGVMSGERATVWRDSFTLWSDAVRKNPGNDTAKYNLADVYLESGQLDKVKPLLEQLLASKPDNARFHELLGHYYYKTGDLENAEKSYRRALELWPKLVNSYLCLGNICLARSNFNEAGEIFEKAGKLGLMTPDLSYSIACLESLKGDLPKALSYLDNAFRLGFRACGAVRANVELDPLRGSPEFGRIMTTYCLDGGS